VGRGFAAGELAEEAGDAGSDEDEGEPCAVGLAESVGEEAEDEGAGGGGEDPDPDGPVENAVVALVAGAHFSGVCIFNSAAVSHRRSFAEEVGKVKEQWSVISGQGTVFSGQGTGNRERITTHFPALP